MTRIDRRKFVRGTLAVTTVLTPVGHAVSQTRSLQDFGGAALLNDQATIYTAREVVTLDEAHPVAEAVAVVGDRILLAGSLDEVTEQLGDQPYEIDDRFQDKVIVPGFIAQHDHPVLAALTMSSEVLAIEDWELPTGTIRAVKDRDDFIARLTQAVERSGASGEPLLSWGYHPDFYGVLTRRDLDEISMERPILVWARSCHEMILNTAAMELGGVSADVVGAFEGSAADQSNFEEARFWEQGLFAVLPYIANQVATPERLRTGLEIARDYMRAKGITIGNEPGGILSRQVQDGVNDVFGSPDMPFRWSFTVDAKSMVAAYDDDARLLAETEALESWYGGMTSMMPRQAKLFSDGAIYSLLIQTRDGFLDGHEGEWMMDLEPFERAFRVYWDAGYQIHIHANGDAGLDRALDVLEANLRRNPRQDHRTVIVHFAVSAFDQVDRIKALGAIVSGNPYYVRALADRYSQVGLGPERADSMVRLGDVWRAGIPWSLHSDMPMAPCDPLYLMWCATTRLTASGRVAGPAQRVSVEAALRGVTIEAAYSLRLEDQVGSIEPGKRANFTILDSNPLKTEPTDLPSIAVWGTVMEGRVFQADAGESDARLTPPRESFGAVDAGFTLAALQHALKVVHTHT